MTGGRLIWVGLFCCLTALTMQVFPDAAFRAGVNIDASWRVFGFGVFLIITAALISFANGGRQKR